jgi:hypothetical protein
VNVFLKHGRYLNSNNISNTNKKGIASRGGVTIAVIDNISEFAWGISKCHLSDVFNRKLGAVRACGRARSKLAFKSSPLELVYGRNSLRDLMDRIVNIILLHGIMPNNQADFDSLLTVAKNLEVDTYGRN